jgi:hypothetical protein
MLKSGSGDVEAYAGEDGAELAEKDFSNIAHSDDADEGIFFWGDDRLETVGGRKFAVVLNGDFVGGSAEY